jgi:hypothetical protein
MKKVTLLFALLFISTIGFSQNKIGGNDPIAGIDIILKKDPSSKPIINTENNPLIDEVNKLELEYLNLKAKEVQYGFGNQDLSKLKTKDEVFKEYITYLKKKIAEEKPKVTKAISYGSTRSNKQTIKENIDTTQNRKIEKANMNINTSRSNKKTQ